MSGKTPPQTQQIQQTQQTQQTPEVTDTGSNSVSQSDLKAQSGSDDTPVLDALQKDSDYKDMGGYAEFESNVTGFGLSKDLALSSWKHAMDQLQTNTDEFARIKDDGAAVLAWVDSDPARAGFAKMADELIKSKPFDSNLNYALWSGKPSHTYAAEHGGTVLEGTHLGKLFDGVNIVFTEWSVTKTLWRAISDRYAREIGKIMGVKKIGVYQRKMGDIFAEVESKALTEIGQISGIPPQYEFHPLITPGAFGGEWGYEAPYANDVWRKKLVEAAGGDAGKAKAAAEAEAVRIFEFDTTVGTGDLVDHGPCDQGKSEGKISQHGDTILAACKRAEKKLKDEAALAAVNGP